MRAALAELVRREVLTVSADRLSPERGSYEFAQSMLRQVAYDTLSRRDRKARHLAVAAHLRQTFAGDGEEITDVIARHYLDALDAVPQDPDVGDIRGQAITALTRAAERAARTGAPALAAASYVSAAQLSQADTKDGGSAAAALWERAAAASITNADHASAVDQAGQARDLYERCGDARAAARAHTIAGEALRRWGRYGEAREHLITALVVLREHPDAHTVRALSELARLEAFTGAPEADALSAEALTLAEDLAVDDATLSELFTTRGLRLAMASRRPQAVAFFREAARLATQAGDTLSLGRALINLADAVTVTDPAAGAEAARDAAAHLRRAGAREYLAFAVINLAGALLMTGDWDGAEAELNQSLDGDGLANIEFLACYRAWLAALRGDTSAAQQALAGLPDLRASEDPQDQSVIAVAEGFIAAASREPAIALDRARAALAHSAALGISNECLRWAWPLATRAAHDLADDTAISGLLALLDDYQPGQLAPMLRAERDLVRVRQAAASDGDQAAAAAFAAAVRSMSELSNPYHLAHGLLDHAGHLLRTGDQAAAVAAIDEARDIAQRLRCQPLLDRIEATTNAEPQPRIPA